MLLQANIELEYVQTYLSFLCWTYSQYAFSFRRSPVKGRMSLPQNPKTPDTHF